MVVSTPTADAHAEDSAAPQIRRRRGALVAACAAALGGALFLGDPNPQYTVDPGLARLLGLMGALKLAFAAPAAGLAWLRLGVPTSAPLACGYAASAALAFAACGLIMKLALVGGGAALFYAALIAFATLAARDPGFATALARAVAARGAKARR